MDKNAIKKYAVWARRELISRVSQRAALYEITADGYGDQKASNVHGRIMSGEEKKQRSALIVQVKEKGYEQVMEEIAYTWFNRFSALRFMEVNGYLPTRIRVFTNDDNAFKPQILDEAINIEMDGLDMQKVYELKNANDDDALFKYMIITQCNALSSILPGMFQRISDYTELLFPDNLLREGSVIEQMIAMIPQEDWTDQVQIIGWLYQYYCLEPFNALYDGEKATDKIQAAELPSATQLFTPDWIVRYMVENSLGRLWLEGHPNDELKADWKYYLDEVEQEPEVQTQLAKIRKEYAALKPEDILAIDPCQGSGHILAYMFDVLIQIYESYGYSAREAASSIVEHNIWGLDIDERASQLAYFSVMMKARQYDRRFFSRGIQPHVYAIQESNNLDPHCIEYFVDGRKGLKTAMDTLIKELHDAKEYGSILNVSQVDLDVLYARFNEIQNETIPNLYRYQAIDTLLPFGKAAQSMAQRYHVVVTNPPYLNANRMNINVTNYVAKYYKESKQDLSMIMYQAVSRKFLLNNAFVSFITPTSWMFSAKFKAIRTEVLKSQRIISVVDCGTELFDGKVGHLYIGAWVAQKHLPMGESRYVNVSEFCYSRRDEKPTEFFNEKNRGVFHQRYFEYLPDMPIAYSISDQVLEFFTKGNSLADVGVARQGLTTSDNKTFTRTWYEVEVDKICRDCKGCSETKENGMRWFPFLKGGAFQKWYQRFDTIVNYENDGAAIKASVMKKYTYLNNPGFVVKNTEWYFKEGISWNDVGGERFNARLLPSGYIFADASPSFFPNDKNTWFYLGYFNSVVFQEFANAICQGLHYSTGQIPKIPISTLTTDTIKKIGVLSKKCYDLVGQCVNEIETSMDYQQNPLVSYSGTLQNIYEEWASRRNKQVDELKENEELINKIFVEAYGLAGIDCSIAESEVSIRKPNRESEIKGLISYAVGCMFGRYSVDDPGLKYAGGTWDESKYSTFIPDKDGILPICDDEYFEDDIVGRFVNFVEAVYGK